MTLDQIAEIVGPQLGVDPQSDEARAAARAEVLAAEAGEGSAWWLTSDEPDWA